MSKSYVVKAKPTLGLPKDECYALYGDKYIDGEDAVDMWYTTIEKATKFKSLLAALRARDKYFFDCDMMFEDVITYEQV